MIQNIFISFCVFLTLSACTIKQEPIRFGTDSCDNCKMLIMDPKFGGVILTKKGKNYKFDDTNCLIAFLNNMNNNQEVESISVIDFSNPELLIDAKTAYYISSSQIKSPMASGIAAFSTLETSGEFIQQLAGTPLQWDELKVNFE